MTTAPSPGRKTPDVCSGVRMASFAEGTTIRFQSSPPRPWRPDRYAGRRGAWSSGPSAARGGRPGSCGQGRGVAGGGEKPWRGAGEGCPFKLHGRLVHPGARRPGVVSIASIRPGQIPRPHPQATVSLRRWVVLKVSRSALLLGSSPWASILSFIHPGRTPRL